jgi:uncharacterized protein YebE (UPF0316 family)
MMADLSIWPAYTPWLPVLIFLARIVDVSIGTVRLICVTRGRKVSAVVLGFFEVLIWILAISTTFSHLDQWINVLAFAGGFAAGNAVGMQIEKKLAMGTQIVQLISRGSAHAVAERLRFADLIVTTMTGGGRDGPVAICLIVVSRKRVPSVVAMAREIDPEVFITVEDAVDGSMGRVATMYPGKAPFRRLPRFSMVNFPGMFRRAGVLARGYATDAAQAEEQFAQASETVTSSGTPSRESLTTIQSQQANMNG